MKRVVQLVTVALLLAPAGVAQQQPRFPGNPPQTILLGTVYDINHALIFRARVVAHDSDGQDYEATTNSEGVYYFDVPGGIYKVEATAEGFCPRRIDKFNLMTGVLDFVLVVPEDNQPCKQRSMQQPTPGTPRDIFRGIAE